MTTLIDFEDYPAGTVVVGQYQPQGVGVYGAEILDGADIAYSGQHYLRSIPGAADIHANPYPVTFTFPDGAKSVSLYAGATGLAAAAPVPIFAKLHAFASVSDDNQIASDPPVLAVPKPIGGTCHTRFSVSTASFDIQRVTLSAFGFGAAGDLVIPFQVIDHLEFEPRPPVHVPHVPEIEHGLYWHILYGIRLGERGIVWGPHGPIPVPPIGPEERAILAAFVANGVAQIIGDVGSRRAIQRAALAVIVQEANRLSESL